MTAAQTTILVLVIVAGTIGPWAIIFVSLLKHSNQTYGPLDGPRSYKTTGRTYFLSFDSLMAYMLLVGAVVIAYLSLRAEITDGTSPWTIYGILGLAVLVMGCLSGYILYLNLNYWTHTRNTTLRFDPEDRTVMVHTAELEYVLREGDIEQVEVVSNKKPKLYYGYFRIKLKSGGELLLTDKMPGVYAIFEYFKQLPVTYHRQEFPIIK